MFITTALENYHPHLSYWETETKKYLAQDLRAKSIVAGMESDPFDSRSCRTLSYFLSII